MKTQAISPVLAFPPGGTLSSAELGWGEEGCCGQAEEESTVPVDTGGLALTAHQELGSFP